MTVSRLAAPDGDRYSFWYEPRDDIAVVRRDRDDVRVVWDRNIRDTSPAMAEAWIAFGAGYLLGVENRLGTKLGPGSKLIFDRGD